MVVLRTDYVMLGNMPPILMALYGKVQYLQFMFLKWSLICYNTVIIDMYIRTHDILIVYARNKIQYLLVIEIAVCYV